MKWPNLRKPSGKGNQWKSLELSKEGFQSISFSSWAKETAAWTLGFGKPCLVVSKDTDPTPVWNKICKGKLRWEQDSSLKTKLDEYWWGTKPSKSERI